MGGFHGYGGGGKMPRTVGACLMAAGVALLLLSVPSWMWAFVLGVFLCSVGFLVWRFL